MRSSSIALFLFGVAVLGSAERARASCNTANFNDPDNDCDQDGQAVFQGDCLDCDVDRLFPSIPDCGTDPNPGVQNFANPSTVRTPAFGGAEICDLFDNTCDSVVDEGFDSDNDGYSTCEGDCNDSSGAIHPGATEQCDGVDQDCDSVGDAAENLTQACYSGPGGTNNVGICHGGTATCTGSSFGTCVGEQVPTTEVCNGLNDDCDAQGADEGLFVDADGDGTRACGSCGAPAAPNCDCNDSNPGIEPGHAEQCDGVDQDCDGVGDAAENITQQCYDNFLPPGGTAGVGLCTYGSQTCTGTSFGTCNGDGTSASATEICDGLDQDCDGTADDGLIDDTDADGSRECGSCGAAAAPNCDCNDNSNAVRPGATETCNGVNDDCDAFTDERNAAGDPLRQSCYEGPGGTQGVGICRSGYRLCVAGAYQADCPDDILPTTEVCNGLNDDCDAQGADEGLIDDTDGDGTPQCGSSCLLPPFDQPGTCDCEDTNAQNEPGRAEVCDGADNNCNTLIDEGFDDDADNYLDCAFCAPTDCDCNDQDNSVNPGAVEDCGPVDRNCNGARFDGFTDADDDNVPACFSTECDDTRSNVHGAYGNVTASVDVCDGLDNDCNSTIDRAANGNVISQNCYEGPAGTAGVGTCVSGNRTCNAAPGSGTSSFGACTGQVTPTNDPALPETTCNGLNDDCDAAGIDDGFDADADGFSTCSGDCDDTSAAVNPNAVEQCDNVDQDCDGDLTDVPPVICFEGPNVTPDTYEGVCPGPGCAPHPACVAGEQTCQPDGTLSSCGGPLVLPSNDPSQAETQCNFLDDDCDGTVDDGPFDQDGDTFTSCGGDCDDADPAINPDALEVCDGADNDCDGTTDGAQTECYSGPAGTVGVGLCTAGLAACIDGVPSGPCAGEVVPVEDVCDAQDNDCDGRADEDYDADGDGFPSCALCSALSADQCDCDDTDRFNHPGRPDLCDCRDNNCDGSADEGDACRGAPCPDFDGDGLTTCEGDCDDANPAVGAGRAEVFGNGRDDDCDGAVDEDVDEDGDGFTTGAGDCDDRFAEVRPDAVEVCDLVDNNCNGQEDEGYDADNDGARVCVGDCNDNDATVSPFRREVCGNAVDDNCDGDIDEDTDVDGDGVTTCNGDCNDFNAAVHPAFGDIPAADEVCDGQANDCVGPADDGFDTDGDFVATCLGDCDDSNADVGPLELEVPGNGVDDNCSGSVDENEQDQDADGFTGACGDCNDNNAAINPHATEACDRVDNNCDAFVDALRDDATLCAVCFDADSDQFTNCDGDCDDTDPAVFPGAEELCNQVDDDCDRRVDLTADGFRVCGDEPDAGVPEDDAGNASPDAGPADEGDAGPDAPEPVVVGCTCGSSGANGPTPMAAAWPFLALALTLRALRRRRGHTTPRLARRAMGRAAAATVLTLLAASSCECGALRVPPGVDLDGPDGEGEGEEGEGEGEGEEGEGEGEPGPCDPELALSLDSADIPGARNPLAVPRNVDVTTLANVAALALDSDADVSGIVLTRPLAAGTDPTALAAAEEILAGDSAILDALPGTPVVSSRVETGSRAYLSRDDAHSPSVTASARVRLAGATTAAQLRDRVAIALAGAAPGDLNDLPPPRQTALFESEFALRVLVRVVDQVSITVVAVTPATLLDHNEPLLSDLTNGTHLGPPGTILGSACEEKVFPVLRADFLFVVDNSGSMQEEQSAIANAASEFAAALLTSGLDARLGVITTDSDVLREPGFTADVSLFQEAVQVGNLGNGVELGLDFTLRAVELALDHPLPERRLREDAARLVIVLSDEDTSLLQPLDRYIDELLADEVIVYAIVGPRPVGCEFVGLGAVEVGERYIEVAQSTGGSSASICNPNLAEAITDILVGAAGAASRSPLSSTPVSGSLVLDVEGERPARSRENGFDYEAASNTVLFFGAARPAEGTPVDISYAYFKPIEG